MDVADLDGGDLTVIAADPGPLATGVGGGRPVERRVGADGLGQRVHCGRVTRIGRGLRGESEERDRRQESEERHWGRGGGR